LKHIPILAVGGSDMKVVIYEASSGKEIQQTIQRDDIVTSLSFSLDGTKLAVGGYDWIAAVYDTSSIFVCLFVCLFVWKMNKFSVGKNKDI